MAVTLNASTSSGFIQTADTSGELNLQSNGTTRLSVLSTGVSGTLIQGTAVASTSGTSIDFTSIPSWVKRITVVLNAISTNGSSSPQIQIGAGSVTTSGYVGSMSIFTNGASVGSSNITTGLGIFSGAASNTISGQIVFTLIGSNVWVGSSNTAFTNFAGTGQSSCSITLGGACDRVRVTTVNGTDTFDAGTINIQYEG